MLIALGSDSRIGNYVFQEGDLSVEQLEEELKFSPNIIQRQNYIENKRNISDEDNVLSNKSIDESDKEELIKESKAIIPSRESNLKIKTKQKIEENALSLYGKDLTESAEKGLLDPVIGRGDEINNLMRVLSRRSKNNPILIGHPGVGKTSIAKLLAQLIVLTWEH